MDAAQHAKTGYRAATRSVRTPRKMEYDVLASITYRLRSAAEKGQDGFIDLVNALNDNRRLWTIFFTDVSDRRNGFPKELKARILYLAEFTFQHTRKVLARTHSVQPLLEINTAILRGLRNGAT